MARRSLPARPCRGLDHWLARRRAPPGASRAACARRGCVDSAARRRVDRAAGPRSPRPRGRAHPPGDHGRVHAFFAGPGQAHRPFGRGGNRRLGQGQLRADPGRPIRRAIRRTAVRTGPRSSALAADAVSRTPAPGVTLGQRRRVAGAAAWPLAQPVTGCSTPPYNYLPNSHILASDPAARPAARPAPGPARAPGPGPCGVIAQLAGMPSAVTEVADARDAHAVTSANGISPGHPSRPAQRAGRRAGASAGSSLAAPPGPRRTNYDHASISARAFPAGRYPGGPPSPDVEAHRGDRLRPPYRVTSLRMRDPPLGARRRRRDRVGLAYLDRRHDDPAAAIDAGEFPRDLTGTSCASGSLLCGPAVPLEPLLAHHSIRVTRSRLGIRRTYLPVILAAAGAPNDEVKADPERDCARTCPRPMRRLRCAAHRPPSGARTARPPGPGPDELAALDALGSGTWEVSGRQPGLNQPDRSCSRPARRCAGDKRE